MQCLGLNALRCLRSLLMSQAERNAQTCKITTQRGHKAAAHLYAARPGCFYTACAHGLRQNDCTDRQPQVAQHLPPATLPSSAYAPHVHSNTRGMQEISGTTSGSVRAHRGHQTCSNTCVSASSHINQPGERSGVSDGSVYDANCTTAAYCTVRHWQRHVVPDLRLTIFLTCPHTVMQLPEIIGVVNR